MEILTSNIGGSRDCCTRLSLDPGGDIVSVVGIVCVMLRCSSLGLERLVLLEAKDLGGLTKECGFAKRATRGEGLLTDKEEVVG